MRVSAVIAVVDIILHYDYTIQSTREIDAAAKQNHFCHSVFDGS